MTLRYVTGDPALTDAHFLAFTHNTRGQTELAPLQTDLLQRYPAPFAAYKRQCRMGRIDIGTVWTWAESRPALVFLAAHETASSTTRLRHIQTVFMNLSRDYLLHGIDSLALMLPGTPADWDDIQNLIQSYLAPMPISIDVYAQYRPGERASDGA